MGEGLEKKEKSGNGNSNGDAPTIETRHKQY